MTPIPYFPGINGLPSGLHVPGACSKQHSPVSQTHRAPATFQLWTLRLPDPAEPPVRAAALPTHRTARERGRASLTP